MNNAQKTFAKTKHRRFSACHLGGPEHLDSHLAGGKVDPSQEAGDEEHHGTQKTEI